jgi:hypothetical protein
MSLTWTEINDGRGGEESYQNDGTTVTTRTKQWRVSTGANATDDVTIMSDGSAPLIGTSHPNHAYCRCVRRSCRPESAAQKQQWIFTAEYSTKWGEINENPLLDPAVTEWSTETFQTPVAKAIDGEPILNSAGDPFDPPAEKDDSRWTSVTRKNVLPTVPQWIFAYQDAVNSDTFTIDGIEIGVGWAKISAIHLSEVQERNEVQYRVLTLTIHYRGEGETVGSGSGSYGSGSGSDEVYPWELQLLDAGMREIDDVGSGASGDVKNIVSPGDKQEVSSPVKLDGEGHAVFSNDPDDAVYLYFEVYRTRAFSSIAAYLS